MVVAKGGVTRNDERVVAELCENVQCAVVEAQVQEDSAQLLLQWWCGGCGDNGGVVVWWQWWCRVVQRDIVYK